MLKGLLTREDALLAVEHGAAGIIVSNHGGRQLDGVAATLDALPEVVEAVAGRCEVYVDGGIRRGTDVLKALALGARAAFVAPAASPPGSRSAARQGWRGCSRSSASEIEVGLALLGCTAPDQVVAEPCRERPSPMIPRRERRLDVRAREREILVEHERRSVAASDQVAARVGRHAEQRGLVVVDEGPRTVRALPDGDPAAALLVAADRENGVVRERHPRAGGTSGIAHPFEWWDGGAFARKASGGVSPSRWMRVAAP